MARWTWDKTKQQALDAVFEGRKTLDAIALSCAVPARTLDYWIAHSDFQQRLQKLYTDIEEATRGKPYVTKTQRIVGLSQMAESAREEYEARRWLKEERQVGRDPESGDPLMQTNEHFNKDAHAAFREALADIAAELGARKNVTELSGALDINEQVTFFLPQPETPPDEERSDDGESSESTAAASSQ